MKGVLTARSKTSRRRRERSRVPTIDHRAQNMSVGVKYLQPLILMEEDTGIVHVDADLIEVSGDKLDVEECIGMIRAVIIDPYEMAERFGLDVHEACLVENEDLDRFVSAFFDFEDCTNFQSEMKRFFEYPFGRTLYIARIEIVDKSRGRGLSLPFLERAIDLLAPGCHAVVMYPCAFGGEAGDEASERLSKHYGRIGFVKLGDTGYVGRDPVRNHPRAVLAGRYAP